MWGTSAHTHAGIGCILLGTNTATHEVWDAMRCLDYLVARPDIDGERLGCMGNSGGGTQTAYLVALDDRIKAASPSCYITNLYERILDLGPQDAEQNIFGQLAWHMDHADYLTMRAPTPTLICAATQDFFDIRGTWDSFRAAKRLYARLGHPERIELVEHDAKHGYAQPLREAAVRWMLRWLAGRDEYITEPEDLQILSQQEILCTRYGQVMREPGARSIYDIAREQLAKLEKIRPPLTRETARRLANIRELAAIPPLQVVSRKTSGGQVERIHLSNARGLHIPALLAHPKNGKPGHVTLVLDARGKHAAFGPDGIATRLLDEGNSVCAIDVRGSGETRQSGQTYHRGQGQDGVDVYMAYLLGRSYVGMRAEDTLAAARWLATELPGTKVHLHAHGALTVSAQHAAYVEPDLIALLTLSSPPPTWTEVVQSGRSPDQLQNAVHGALRAYRLSDLDR
jgi:cephalosporin-C deacetylase-like acetyl esterase